MFTEKESTEFELKLIEYHSAMSRGLQKDRCAAVRDFVNWGLETARVKTSADGSGFVEVYRIILPNGTQIELFKEYFTKEKAISTMEGLVAEGYNLGKLFK